ncbi:MAG: hypothetical protein KDA61_11505 [Planctomycetales bacterium]|nr:hypothetical protein [Planctomycetales bacterium]
MGTLVVAAATIRAHALNIVLDFSQESLIFANSTARAAAEAAATDLGAAITSTLNSINTDVWTGSYQSTTASFDFQFIYDDPVTSSGEISDATIAANAVRVIMRSRALTGQGALGEGGPYGLAGNVNLSGFPSQAPVAVTNAATKAENAYLRGGAGPLVSTLASDPSSSVWNGVPFPYAIDFGVSGGAIWLDADSDNNGVVDSSATLANYWHYDHTTAVGTNKNDLYSVVLHELMHVLGIGSSETWSSLSSGDDWLGDEVATLVGSGANMIVDNHIAYSKMSVRLSDGATQEASMDPNLTRGQRKELTLLDLAFLRDIGWDTVTPIPSFNPADFNQDGQVDDLDFAVWQSAWTENGLADANGDGKSDGSDFLAWQRALGAGGSSLVATTTIPEPAAGALAALAAFALYFGRRC